MFHLYPGYIFIISDCQMNWRMSGIYKWIRVTIIKWAESSIEIIRSPSWQLNTCLALLLCPVVRISEGLYIILYCPTLTKNGR